MERSKFKLKNPTDLKEMLDEIKEGDLESKMHSIEYISTLHNLLHSYQLVLDQISYNINSSNRNINS